MIARRAEMLREYQNPAYADMYEARIARVRAAESNLGLGEQLTYAAATYLAKLMAYKDEYEVARLYTDGRFAKYRAETWTGGKAKVWLAPPLIARKGSDGKPQKIAFSGWVLDAVFPVLARLKGLRGTALDLFGYSEERAMERGLITAFEGDLDRIAQKLTAARLPTALKLAQVPQSIRGYGHVKEASVGPAKAESARLWGVW